MNRRQLLYENLYLCNCEDSIKTYQAQLTFTKKNFFTKKKTHEVLISKGEEILA